MYLVSSGFSFKPTSSSSSSSSTQFSQEWARRKVVVKHSIKSKIKVSPTKYVPCLLGDAMIVVLLWCMSVVHCIEVGNIHVLSNCNLKLKYAWCAKNTVCIGDDRDIRICYNISVAAIQNQDDQIIEWPQIAKMLICSHFDTCIQYHRISILNPTEFPNFGKKSCSRPAVVSNIVQITCASFL